MRRVYLLVTLSALLVIALDQWTKIYAVNELQTLGNSIPFFESWWNWTLVHNYGAAFGMFRDMPEHIRGWFFAVLKSSILILVWFLFVRKFKKHEILGPIAIGLVYGGAIGNIIDRARLGYVIDFVDWFYPTSGGCLPLFFRSPGDVGNCHWPVFNVADSAISIAMGLLVLYSFLQPDEEMDNKPKSKNKKKKSRSKKSSGN